MAWPDNFLHKQRNHPKNSSLAPDLVWVGCIARLHTHRGLFGRLAPHRGQALEQQQEHP